MSSYAKLFSSILDSTVWGLPQHVRLVWITMLAMKDQHGVVEAAIPGLAKRAGVTLEQCEEALNSFLSPDPYSRTKDNQGRRIAEIEGGWQILNHRIYRDKESVADRREKDAARAKAYRERHVTRHGASRCVTENHDRHAIRCRDRSESETDSERECEIQTRAPAAPTRTQPPAVDRVPEFGARQMATLFVREYEAVQRSTPSMGGKHVDGLHAMVCRTAELQGVSPESLFLDTVRAWLGNPLSDRDRQSPYACFCQAWGSLTARGTAKTSDGITETVASLQEAAQAAVARGDLAEVKRLNARRRELEDAADRGMRRGR